MKLNRSQIKEALETTPIDKLLLGGNAKDISLTPKQKAFAEQIAKGESKAKAYRKAYNSKGSSHTQSKEGAKLMTNPTITHHVETIRLAIEAQKYLYPTHLRALVIQQLTEKALDPEVNHAQQIKALELIGKFSEVNLFQERREIKTDINTIEAKAKLLDTLTNAIRTSRTLSEDKKQSANDLLQEITQGLKDRDEPITIDQEPSHDDEAISQVDEPTIFDTAPTENPTIDDPTRPHPPKNYEITGQHMHTIPHQPLSLETTPIVSETKEGEGVYNFWERFERDKIETPPLVNSGSPTPPINISNPNWKEV